MKSAGVNGSPLVGSGFGDVEIAEAAGEVGVAWHAGNQTSAGMNQTCALTSAEDSLV